MKQIISFILFSALLFSCTSKKQPSKQAFYAHNNDSDSLRLTQINDSLKNFPKNVKLWVERGRLSRKMLDFRSALDAGARAYMIDSTDLDARKLYAWSLINKPKPSLKDIASAQRHFKFILSKKPKDPEALVDLANTYALTGDIQPAIENINKALKIDENYKDAYVLKGSIYKTIGKYKLALSSYQTAIQLDPKFFMGYLHTGWLLTEMKKHKLALEYYRSASQLRPQNPESLYGIAKSLQDLKEYPSALREYRHLAHVDSTFYITYYNQGYIKQYYQNQPDSALYYYKKVLDQNSQYVRAWFQMGKVYYSQGNRGKAEKAYSNCLRLDKNYGPAIEEAKKLKTLD